MNRYSLTQANPEHISEAFLSIEAALQQVLPGHESHPRYEHAKEIGLAVVIGLAEQEPGAFNPLNPSSTDNLHFLADNQIDHPLAWTRLEKDPEWLGAQMPVDEGGFITFAKGKLATIHALGTRHSFRPDRSELKPGEVSFAGGREYADGMIAVSGLNDKHDLIALWELIREARLGRASNLGPRSIDEIASELDYFFKKLQRKHPGDPTGFTAEKANEIVVDIDRFMRAHFKKQSEQSRLTK